MALILFGVFIALLLLGVPVAFAICSAAATTMFAGFGTAKMMIVVQRMFASCDSFSLIAVPFFIFAGDLLAGGKISKVLVEFCESLLGMIKGGLSRGLRAGGHVLCRDLRFGRGIHCRRRRNARCLN